MALNLQVDDIVSTTLGPVSFSRGYTTANGVFPVSNAGYTILTTDGYSVIEMTTGASTRVVTLPAVASSAGRQITISKVDSGAGFVTITPNGGTINGNTTWTLNALNTWVTLYTDGTNWYIQSSSLGTVNKVNATGYTILNTDGYSTIEMTTGASNQTVTLPNVASNTGRIIYLTKVDSAAGKLIIACAGADLINGAAANRLSAQYSFLAIQSDGINWAILAVSDQLGSTSTDITAATNLPVGTGTYFDVISFTVPEGTWLATGGVRYTRNSATFTALTLDTGFATTTGNVSPTSDSRGYIDFGSNLTTWADYTIQSKNFIISGTTNTVSLFMKGFVAAFSAGTPQYQGSMRLIRLR